MKCNLWDVNQEETCGYCVYAKRMHDGDNVICRKRNNVFPFSATCRKFEFDILKCVNQDLTKIKENLIYYMGDYPQGTTYREMNVFLRLLFKQPVSFSILNEELEMSRSSFKRTIAMLRGVLENSISLHGTIQYNSKRKTYYLVLSNSQIEMY